MPDWKAWAASLDNKEPIYAQIADRFKRSVMKGEMPPGSRAPSIRELSQLLQVNPNTVNRAYQEMERDGLIYSQRGMGYYIAENAAQLKDARSGMIAQETDAYIGRMTAMGLTGREMRDALQERLAKEESSHG